MESKRRRTFPSEIFFLPVLVGTLLPPPQAWSEDWQVAWKDSMTTLRVDKDSIRVKGQTVEYWYSEETDALVDWAEYRYDAVSDCENNRLRLIRMYDPSTGQTKELESEWRDMSYDSQDPVKVMHEEVCRSYAAR